MTATTETTRVTVRPLQAKDLFTLAELLHNSRAEVEAIYRQRKPAPLAKLGEASDVPAEPVAAGNEDLGTAIIFGLLGQARSGIRPWLADMANMRPEKFDKLPLGDTLGVIEDIVRQEDWPAFLARLSGMFTGRAT